MKKLALVMLAAFALSVIAGYAAEPAKKAPAKKVEPAKKAESITGTVAQQGEGDKKVIVIQTDAGDVIVAGAKAKELEKSVGKKVKVTGIIKEADGKKTITATAFSLVKEEAPKKAEPPKKEPPKKEVPKAEPPK